jgi:dienelactone hydrolase
LKAVAALACCLALPAAALNHEDAVAPIAPGPFAVACSNMAMDTDRLAQLGGDASDYWEGNPYPDGRERYVTDILAYPDAVVRFDTQPPFKPGMYPTTFFRRLEFVVMVCHPTSRSNTDPDYILPGGGGRVPHMQAPYAVPKLLSAAEHAQTLGLQVDPLPPGPAKLPVIVYSHGLGGSPLGKGYIDVAAALASHGFVVSAIFHADARFAPVRIENLPEFAFVLAFYPLVSQLQALRPLSLKAMTDHLLADPWYSPAIDASRIGGFGASFGGEAMAHLVGARMTTSIAKSCGEPEHDERIRAVATYVPYSGQTFLPAFCDDQEGADSVNRPFFAMAGTADLTAPIKLTQQAINRMPSSHFLVELIGGEHELRPEDAGDLTTWTITFLNAYMDVRTDPGAMARFIRMRQVIGGRVDNMIVDVHVPLPNTGGEMRTIEFYNTVLEHYFLAAGQDEIDKINAGGAGPSWEETGESFKAWLTMPSDTLTLAAPVCRFYGGLNGGPNTHFFTASAQECDLVKRNGGWFYEGIGFYIRPVDATRRCPDGMLSVNRAYNNGAIRHDPNHRHSTSDSTMAEMARKGWTVEGTAMCARP